MGRSVASDSLHLLGTPCLTPDALSRSHGRIRAIILASCVTVYVLALVLRFWTLPIPSDPLQYVGPATWGSTYGWWPWLDRLMLAINLRIVSWIVPGSPLVGPLYVGAVNTAILVLCMVWAGRRAGFVAAFLAGVFILTSFLFLAFATYVYPDQTVALFALLALMAFDSDAGRAGNSKVIALSGGLAACAVLTKITGAAIGFYLLWQLLSRRNWRGLSCYLIGGITGGALIAATFAAMYSPAALKNVCRMFFRSTALSGNPEWTNLVSYLEVLVCPRYFPVYIALFVALRAYRDRDVRILFGASWSFILLIYAIYTFTARGGAAIPTYIYATFPLAATGLAIYLARIFNRHASPKNPAWWKRPTATTAICGVTLTLVLAGALVGVSFRHVKRLSIRYHQQTDVFKPATEVDFPRPVRWFYTAGPLATLAALCWAEASRRRIAVVAVMLSLSWVGAANTGFSYMKVKFDRGVAAPFYEAADALAQVRATRYAVYCPTWKQKMGKRVDRVLWVYWVFHDSKFPRADSYDALLLHERAVRRNIHLLTDRDELANCSWDSILTDDPDAVLESFPAARLVQEFTHHGVRYFEYDLAGNVSGVQAP